MAQLLHINGLPGVGKTSVGRHVAESRPLALVVDIDQLRTQLGQWEHREESKLVARDLAIALITTHLSAGHDVVVPQYLGRIEFIDRLERTAVTCGATFVEVLLEADVSVAADRFLTRRSERTDSPHPEAEIPDGDVPVMTAAAADLLEEICAARPNIRRIDARGELDDVAAAVLTTIEP